jgi:ABC-type antimicrobial peptide transport system permease subunit
VIGVVRDVDSAASTSDPSTIFQVYKPLVHEPWSYVNVVVRSPTPGALGDSVRRAISEVDADLAAAQVGTVRQIVDQQQHNLVLAAQSLTGFALLGLLLASIGLYGVISNLVTQRTGEFGIRLALGARPHDVLVLVLKHGLQLVAVGLVLGLAGAYGVGRLLGGIMPRIANPDAGTLLAVAAVLLVVALIACWLPARRATRVDPMIALRAE